jgi:iron complex outermembrane receptor protein
MWLASASGGALALAIPAVSAAQAAGGAAVGASASDTVAEVVVTGSFIRGAAKNAALPVSVLSSEELAKVGAPTVADLTRLLPASTGTDGESNQFNSPNLEGVSNINLRGLGAARTLVLWNGRRLAQSPIGATDGQYFVDTNLLPLAAVQRIEILKEGAAALYGSDAVAGVVNFISNRNLKGLAVSADYRWFHGTDGDWTGSLAYGLQRERFSWLTAVGYQHRSEAPAAKFDFASVPATVAIENGYTSIGNPGTIRQVGGAAFLPDPGCAAVGSTPLNGVCYFHAVPLDNLVEKEDHYQVYSEATYDLTDTLKGHAEVLWARSDIPDVKTSPSFPPNRPTNFVPANSPGLVALLAANPQLVAANPFLQPAALAQTGGVNVTARAYGAGGNPETGAANIAERYHETFRVAGELSGQFNDNISWTASATYQKVDSKIIIPDTFSERFSNALRGLGGPNCKGDVPGANGCVYFNPFSNAIQTSALTGAANPGYNPAVANSLDLYHWLTGQWGFKAQTQILVLDAVVNGKTGLTLPGGDLAFAVGAQFRKDSYKIDPLNADSDFAANPCPTPGAKVCANQSGLFGFEGPVRRNDASRDVKAVFLELNAPILKNLQSQLAIRYEDYGSGVGSTVNPKVAMRWEPVSGLVLRGSANSTFRGPQLSQLTGVVTTLQLIAPTGAFKPIDINGNGALKPEKAFSYSLGAVFERNGFRISADYYAFRFRDPIIIEPFSAIVTDVLNGIAKGAPSPLAGRVSFDDANSNGVNEASEINRVAVSYVNGPDIDTDGLDLEAEQRFDVGRGTVRVGAEASYIFNYNVGPTFVGSLRVVNAFNGVGRANLSTAFVRPLPRWKGNAYVEYGTADFNIRYTLRHTTSYADERFTANPAAAGRRIKAFTTHDLNLLWRTPYGVTLTGSIINLTDRDPPFARFNYDYDGYTAYPFGRTLKVGLSAKF